MVQYRLGIVGGLCFLLLIVSASLHSTIGIVASFTAMSLAIALIWLKQQNPHKSLMKRLLTILAIVLGMMANTQAQTTIKPTDKVQKDTLIGNVKYPIYVGKKGGRYTIRTSKAGNMYKSYIKTKLLTNTKPKN